MNEQTILSAAQALDTAIQGGRCRMIATPLLIQVQNEKVLVSGRNYFARFSFENFLDLYGQESFIISQSEEGIDEKKDAEYYAWARRSQ